MFDSWPLGGKESLVFLFIKFVCFVAIWIVLELIH